jgi:hypothetical protein
MKFDTKDVTGRDNDSAAQNEKMNKDYIKKGLYGKPLRDRMNKPLNRRERKTFAAIKRKFKL